MLDANASVIANLSFIADPFANLTTAQGNAIIAGGGTYTPATNESSVLVKAAVVEELGFGYSRPMLSRETGDLTAGVRAKYYLVKLARNAQHQTSTTAGGSQSTLNASQNYTSSSGVGLDVGTLWTAKRYRVGAWVNNVNKPSFNYNTVDTTGYANPTVIAQLNTNGTYDMKPQLQRKGHFIRKARTGSSMQDWMPMQCKMLWAETSSGQR